MNGKITPNTESRYTSNFFNAKNNLVFSIMSGESSSPIPIVIENKKNENTIKFKIIAM